MQGDTPPSMADLLVAVWVTPMYEHIEKRMLVVDLPHLQYLPIIAQLSSGLNSRVNKFIETVETNGEFYCDDYLTHEQATDYDDIPARMANTLRLSNLVNTTNNGKLFSTLRSLWSSKLFYAFSLRIDDTPHIAKLFAASIHFLTDKMLSPPDGGYKVSTENVFSRFVTSLKDFCHTDGTQATTITSCEIMILDMDLVCKMHREYMEESLAKKMVLYTDFRKIGFNHPSANLLKFIHRNAHLDMINTNLLKRLVVEFQCNDIYTFSEKLCQDDNKYIRECLRNGVENGADISSGQTITMDDIRDSITLFFESMRKFILESGVLSDDEKKQTYKEYVVDYVIRSYHNLCSMFVIIFEDFHYSVKFQTILVSCLLEHIIPEAGGGGGCIYTKQYNITRLVGKIDKYKYDIEKMNIKMEAYRKLLLDLKPTIEEVNLLPDDYYSEKASLSYPFKMSELPLLPASIANLIERKVSTVSIIKTKKIVDPNEIKKIQSMSLEDFTLYIARPIGFTVKKCVLREKYATLLLDNFKILGREKHEDTISKFHIMLILMVQLSRRIDTSYLSFHDDPIKKRTVDDIFNIALRMFLATACDAMIFSASDTCPCCRNNYKDCLAPVETIAEFVVLEDLTINMVIQVVKSLPKYAETGKIYDTEEEGREKKKRADDDERDNDKLEEMRKEFEFLMKDDEKYSFL